MKRDAEKAALQAMARRTPAWAKLVGEDARGYLYRYHAAKMR
jgi:hypothetical protein